MFSRAAYHRAVGVGPDLVPVGGDGRASLDGSSKLKSTGGTIIIAGKGCGCRILDGVAESF